jgi:hypothetical protein
MARCRCPLARRERLRGGVVISVPGSRDPALTDDIIEAAAKTFDDMYAEGQFWTSEEVAERLLAAVVPLLRAQWKAENIEAVARGLYEKHKWHLGFGDDVTWERESDAYRDVWRDEAARVARGGDQD